MVTFPCDVVARSPRPGAGGTVPPTTSGNEALNETAFWAAGREHQPRTDEMWGTLADKTIKAPPPNAPHPSGRISRRPDPSPRTHEWSVVFFSPHVKFGRTAAPSEISDHPLRATGDDRSRWSGLPSRAKPDLRWAFPPPSRCRPTSSCRRQATAGNSLVLARFRPSPGTPRGACNLAPVCCVNPYPGRDPSSRNGSGYS